jgi:twitching motility protein PilT
MSPQSAIARTEWSRQLARALVTGGYLTDEAVAPVLAQATQTGVGVGALLIGRSLVPAPVVVTTMAQLANLPAIDLQSDVPTAETVGMLSPVLARDHQAVVVRVVGGQAVVAFAEPPDPAGVQAVAEHLGLEVVPVLGDPVTIERLLGAGNGRPPSAAGTAALGSRPLMTVAPGTTAPATGAGSPAQAGAAPPITSDLGAGNPAAQAGTQPGPAQVADVELRLHVDDLLRYAVSIGASDLHLTTNMPPTVRLHGALRPMEDVERLDHETLRDMIYGILPQIQRERFEAEHELDTSHTIAGVGRFRVNVCLQRGTIAVAMRPIPHEIPEFATLGLPESVRTFTELRRGLVLVTGPTGSGKSTTLASLIDIINQSKPLHVVTVEDPIEFLHNHKRCVISQREVGADTGSFSEALRRVLRQDPDVILVGELRDLETISTALTAAETGHLVFATLHTQDAPSTIDRIIDVFSADQQDQIRIQLASSLQGVVTQQLVPTVDGSGRAVGAEVLVCTPAIQNLIRGAKTHQIYSLMQTGGQYGMQTMDQSLAMMVTKGVVSQGVALDRCRSEEDFRNHLHGL